jgi:hypothetical protein
LLTVVKVGTVGSMTTITRIHPQRYIDRMRSAIAWFAAVAAVVAFAVTIGYAFTHEASPAQCAELGQYAGLLEECR